MFQITCQYETHQRDSIIGFCMNKNCENPGQCCLQCMQQQHQAHSGDCKGFLEIGQFIKSLLKQAESLENCQIVLIQKVKDVLSKLAKESKKHFDKLQQLNAMLDEFKYYELKNEIQFLKQLYSQESENKGKYSNRYQDLVKEFNKLSDEFNKMNSSLSIPCEIINEIDKKFDQSLERQATKQSNKKHDVRIKIKSIKKHDQGKVLYKINKPVEEIKYQEGELLIETCPQDKAVFYRSDLNYEYDFECQQLKKKKSQNKAKRYYKKKQKYYKKNRNETFGNYFEIHNYYVYYEPLQAKQQPQVDKYPQTQRWSNNQNYSKRDKVEKQIIQEKWKEPVFMIRQTPFCDQPYEEQKQMQNQLDTKKGLIRKLFLGSTIKIIPESSQTPCPNQPIFITPRFPTPQNIQPLHKLEKETESNNIIQEIKQPSQIQQKSEKIQFPSAQTLVSPIKNNESSNYNKQDNKPTLKPAVQGAEYLDSIKRTNQKETNQPRENPFFQCYVDQFFKDIFCNQKTINKNKFNDYYQRGYELHCEKKYKQAIECYNQAINLESNCAQIYYNKGCCLQRQQQYEDAIESYDKAISLNKDFTDALNNKGIALKNLQKYDAAIQAFNAVIQLQNSDEVAYNNKGNCLHAMSKYDEAVKCYEKAIQINSNYKEAFQNKCISLECQKNYKGTKILNTQNQAREYNNQGCDLDLIGKYDEAIMFYNKALSINPCYAIAYYNKGRALQSLLHNKEAISCYQQATQFDPELEDAQFNINIIFFI